MAQTKINASQTTITAKDIGAAPVVTAMPAASSATVGEIVQFVGTTDSTYTNGYFYEGVGTTTPAATSETVSSSTMSNVTVNVATFVSELDSISEGDPETYSAIVDDILDGTSPLICSYMDDGGGDVTWCLLLGPYTMVYGSLAGVGIAYSGAPAEGDTITVDYTPESTVYAWTRKDVQPQGDSLPPQAGNNGKFLTTDGSSASWGIALVNNTTNANSLSIQGSIVGTGGGNTVIQGTISSGNAAGSVAIGQGSTVWSHYCVAIGNSSYADYYAVAVGYYASASNTNATAIGYGAIATARNAIQLGTGDRSTVTNADANTFKVANGNGNFEMMSADGTIPTARLTKVNSTITLAAADWSSNTQTVTVNGVTSTSIVWVSPDPTDQSAYVAAGILCSAQGTNSLTFTATTTPSADIDVVVVAM